MTDFSDTGKPDTRKCHHEGCDKMIESADAPEAKKDDYLVFCSPSCALKMSLAMVKEQERKLVEIGKLAVKLFKDAPDAFINKASFIEKDSWYSDEVAIYTTEFANAVNELRDMCRKM